MWLIDQLAEQRIREAQQEGAFDRLPGAGLPLQLEDDSGVPAELRTAYRLLKNAGYLPQELRVRREISELKQLLAAAQDVERRAGYGRRLRYLLTWLGLSQRSSCNLQTEAAYFDRLCAKLDLPHEVSRPAGRAASEGQADGARRPYRGGKLP